MKWTYAVTTVPSRRTSTFPLTLESLNKAGFDQPRLFIDGPSAGYHEFGLDFISRETNIGTVGNWILALYELYLRSPTSDRYAVFQDDLKACRNLKQYLSAVKYPAKAYLNLYTFPHNQPDQLSRRVQDGEFTHSDVRPDAKGFYRSCQYGKGAVALVFDRPAVMALLASSELLTKAQDPVRGKSGIDGTVAEALKLKGWTEYVHSPSLTQHIGKQSSMGNPEHQQAISFPGEDFDAMELLACSETR